MGKPWPNFKFHPPLHARTWRRKAKVAVLRVYMVNKEKQKFCKNDVMFLTINSLHWSSKDILKIFVASSGVNISSRIHKPKMVSMGMLSISNLHWVYQQSKKHKWATQVKQWDDQTLKKLLFTDCKAQLLDNN